MPPVVLVTKPEKVNDKVSAIIGETLNDIDTSEYLLLDEDTLFATRFLYEIYDQNKNNVMWTDKGVFTKQGDSLISIIKHAAEYGLLAADYHYFKIDSLIRTELDSVTKKFDAVKIAKADILLTDAFFTFVVHVSKGRINADSLTKEWKGIPELLDTNLVEILNNVYKINQLRAPIDSLEPKNKQYIALKAALKNFKMEFAADQWDSLASRETDSLTFKERIKTRLIASHDYSEGYNGNDSIKLLKAIKNFQCRHNLVEDGKIGKLTFKALQRTKEDYIRQIEMNMERWRWTKQPDDKQYVWVNIPKYEMRVYEEDTLVMKSRVITGAAKTKTPLLKSTIRYFIIYPYWTVPYSIIKKEILPILKRDTSYIRRKNFEVLDRHGYVTDHTKINWKKYNANYVPFRLRQRIGDDNSLGILKFNFNNKHGVYMHDTDNRRLFGREMRAMSHGCVRLENFVDFAKFLIRDDSVKYPVDSFMADLSREQQKYVYMKKPVPVYIRYFTAEVDENGQLNFFIDVYKRDEKMLEELYRNKRTNY